MTTRRILPLPGALAALGIVVLAALPVGCGGDSSASEGSAAIDAGGLKPIREAPPFELETLAGDSLTLDQVTAGKKAVLINFWASWCLPCRDEMPDLVAVDRAYADRGLAVLGATVNDLPRDSRRFANEMGLPYPSVVATPAVLEAWEIAPWLPTTVLVKDGKVVREWVGPQTRRQFEYPIKVALGLAPPVSAVTTPGASGE